MSEQRTTEILELAHDEVSKMIAVLDIGHSEIHYGQMFTTSQQNASLASSGTLLFEIITPDSGYVHLKEMFLLSEGKAQVELIEAPTITTGTTPLTALNRNRTSSNTADVVVKSNPTAISAGTELENFIIGAEGTPSISLPGNFNMDSEWVLKQSTTYLFRVTNLEASAKAVTAILHWYESN